jgi:hypothetical protein
MARVRVFNQSLLEGLVIDEFQNSKQQSKDSSPQVEEQPTLNPAKLARQQQIQHLAELEDIRQRRYDRNRMEAAARSAEADRQVREQLVVNNLRREEKFQRQYSSIMEGKELAARIKKQQDLEDQAELNKKMRMFDEWNLEVYGKIQSRVNEKLDAVSTNEITSRRNEEFQKFLNTTNTKGAIFRDIIIESEYDPLEPNRNCVKVKSDDLVDPTSRVLDKARDEKHMLASKATLQNAKKCHTREVLDVVDWGTGRIESTPHGFFEKMMSKSTQAPKPVSGTFKSMVKFDDYQFERGIAPLQAEFPKGKRMHPILP